MRSIVNDDINKDKISLWNGGGINYVTLNEDMQYFSHTPQCYAVHKLSLLFSNG